MYNLKLLVTLVKINIQQELAYRTDAIVNILVNLMWLGWELLSLSILDRAGCGVERSSSHGSGDRGIEGAGLTPRSAGFGGQASERAF